jgi:hypothetical protein
MPSGMVPFDFAQQLRTEYESYDVKDILCAIQWPADYDWFKDYNRKDIKTQYGFEVIWREY